jgi:hypothetical protein
MKNLTSVVAATAGIMVVLVIASSLFPVVYAQSNQTGSIMDKLKSASEKNKMKATAAGDLVFVLVCPKDFNGDVNKCQIFVGQAA